MHFPLKYNYILHCIMLAGILVSNGYAQDTHERLNAYEINKMELNLEITNTDDDLAGNVAYNIVLRNNTVDSLALELIDQADVDSVMLNDVLTPFTHKNNLILFALPDTFSINDNLQLRVFYELIDGDILNNRGVTNVSRNPDRAVTYTLTEPFYAKYWFPCKEVLEDKIDTALLNFTIPENCLVGSNGVLTNIEELPDNKKLFKWKTYYPTTYYLISFAVADYLDYSFYATIGEGDSVLVQNYIYNDSTYLREKKAEIDDTAPLLKLFSDKFGRYPFAEEKYGHAVAPIFGGMEHQTMTTLSDFNFTLVAHELAHQWFGDYVTCSDWSNIWINEGFASYAEYIALEGLRESDMQHGWLEDAFETIMADEGGSVYVPEDQATNDNRIFNYRLSYRKGAYLLHMLRHEIDNDSLFFKALRTYLAEYRFSVAGEPEFTEIINQETQQDFTDFFEQWYYGEGYPIYDFQWQQTSDTFALTVIQETSVPSVTPFFGNTIDIRINYLGGDTLVKIKPSQNNQTFKIRIPGKAYQISPNPDKWVLAEIRSINRLEVTNSNSEFSIFPNPTNDVVYIENYQVGLPFEVTMYSLNGTLITKAESTQAFVTMNLESLESGIYQLIVTRNSRKEVFKVAKP